MSPPPVLTIVVISLWILDSNDHQHTTVQTQLLCSLQQQQQQQPPQPPDNSFWSSRKMFLLRHLCLPLTNDKTNNVVDPNESGNDATLSNDDNSEDAIRDEEEEENGEDQEDREYREDKEVGGPNESNTDSEPSPEVQNPTNNPTSQLANFQYIRQPNQYQWESALKRGSDTHQIYQRLQSDQLSGQARTDSQWFDPEQIGRQLIVWQ